MPCCTSSERAIPKSVTFAAPSPFSEHVLRLDVPVDEALPVRERQAVCDLDHQLERLLDRQRPVPLDQPLQVLALDVLEDDELPALMLAAVDHRDDVRMRERGDGPRLAAEPLDLRLVRAVVLVQHLQRDLAGEQPVVRPVDARHSSGPDELLELVSA